MTHRALACLCALAVVVTAAPPASASPSSHAASPRVARPARAADWSYERRLDVNRVRLAITNHGWLGFQPGGTTGGLWYPAESTATLLYTSGPWLGALVGGDTCVTTAEYFSEFVPGAIVGGQADDPLGADYDVWKVCRWTGNPLDSAHVERAITRPDEDAIVHHAWSEYMAHAAPRGAPWKTYRLPNSATPDPGDSLDVPGPDVLGDQMAWCVFNDADPNAHIGVGSTAPLGAHVEQTVYGLDRPGVLGDAVFVRWRIRDLGASSWTGLRAGVWTDPDIGNGMDDRSGCDTTRSLGFTYNGDGDDTVYGDHPPVLGLRLLGTTPGGAGPLHAFRVYFNGSDPRSATEALRMLAGRNPDGTPLVDPGLNATRYQYAGSPVAGTGWLDTASGDKRMVSALAPQDVAPDGSLDLWAAYLVSPGPGVATALAELGARADSVRAEFERGPGHVVSVDPIGPRGRLALSGFSPNPARGPLAVAFTLASSAPARLEVLDLAGRRVWARALANPAAGRHVVALDGARLAPGVYVVRLEQEGDRAAARGVVLR